MAEERIRTTPNPTSPGTEITRAKSDKPVPFAQDEMKSRKPAQAPRDTIREILETVVFVIILVLLLKTFIAEAFVIPTGSMATTLFGHHETITCPQCGFQFEVNTSSETPEMDQPAQEVIGCTCPNCRYHITLQSQSFP